MGAAKFLRGLVAKVPPEQITVIVNTGDDENFYGLHVSPDVDTVIYTLAGVVNPAHGWGLKDDSFVALDALARFYGKPWFNLGDRDLATHLYRTQQLRAGESLSEVTAAISQRFGVRSEILPMSNDRLRTWVKVRGRPAMPFQEYFVRNRSRGVVERIELREIEKARPLPAALAAIRCASAVILAPSNPLVSLGPILALKGMRQTLAKIRPRVAAISPIVGGRTLKGPADKMLRGMGFEVSPLGVARLYRDIAGVFVMDMRDRDYLEPVRTLGMKAIAVDTVMTTPAKAARLAGIVLDTLAV